MKTKIIYPSKKETLFRDISVGEVFVVNYCVYMRMKTVFDGGEPVANAVSLETGDTRFFYHDIAVQRASVPTIEARVSA